MAHPVSKLSRPPRLPPPPQARSAEGGRPGTQSGLRTDELVDSRYQIQDVVGEGGAGRVYGAIHLKLGRPVAIKVLRDDDVSTESARARFEREAMALAGLNHPNIVSVSDYGVHRGRPYIAMEMLKGRTLRDALDEGPLSANEALRVTRELLHALAYAHSEGVVHRDLKPANVFLQAFPTQADHVKLLDYGFAKFVTCSPLANAPALTAVGVTFGTPAYVAPERLGGGEVDGRADLYAVGVLLFEMLTGVKPFDGPAPEVLRMHLTTPVPALSDRKPGLVATPELTELLTHAMSKTLANRFADAAAFLRALDALPEPCVSRDEASKLAGDDLPTGLGVPAADPGRDLGPSRTGGSTRPSWIESLSPKAVEGLHRFWRTSQGAAHKVWLRSRHAADRVASFTRARYGVAVPRIREGWSGLTAQLGAKSRPKLQAGGTGEPSGAEQGALAPTVDALEKYVPPRSGPAANSSPASAPPPVPKAALSTPPPVPSNGNTPGPKRAPGEKNKVGSGQKTGGAKGGEARPRVGGNAPSSKRASVNQKSAARGGAKAKATAKTTPKSSEARASSAKGATKKRGGPGA